MLDCASPDSDTASLGIGESGIGESGIRESGIWVREAMGVEDRDRIPDSATGGPDIENQADIRWRLFQYQ